ncbi:caprin-2-like [Saccostrea cucullata]|uniref:caprin-2-like n=1 Tax=Saccostrea cuccullata TaxID=36930 RepID=UPI002ED13FD0
MNYFLRICVLRILSRISIALSFLSDQNDGNWSRDFVSDNEPKIQIFFRQLLNQESIIRMNLANNVESLKKDMATFRESMGTAMGNVKNKVLKLEATVERLKTENERLKVELQDTKAKEGNLSSLVATIQAALSNISSLVLGMTKRVGFSASVSSSSPSWNSGTLVFPSVVTNEGNGYNPHTGIFTSPTAGMYVFFVNAQSYDNYDIYTYIVLNGSQKVRTLANSGGHDYNEAGVNLVVLTLLKGDTVWVKHSSGHGYYSSGPITTFSGFLL